jgi:hypothetical protein
MALGCNQLWGEVVGGTAGGVGFTSAAGPADWFYPPPPGPGEVTTFKDAVIFQPAKSPKKLWTSPFLMGISTINGHFQ